MFRRTGLFLLIVLCTFCNEAAAADRPEKPSTWFCMQARAHRASFASDKAAEDAARAQGASQADINKAHRCRR